jgi:hypothetical protein
MEVGVVGGQTLRRRSRCAQRQVRFHCGREVAHLQRCHQIREFRNVRRLSRNERLEPATGQRMQLLLLERA